SLVPLTNPVWRPEDHRGAGGSAGSLSPPGIDLAEACRSPGPGRDGDSPLPRTAQTQIPRTPSTPPAAHSVAGSSLPVCGSGRQGFPRAQPGALSGARQLLLQDWPLQHGAVDDVLRHVPIHYRADRISDRLRVVAEELLRPGDG